MRNLKTALVGALALALAPLAPAFAVDDYIVKDAAGAVVTMKAKDNGVSAPAGGNVKVPTHTSATADGLTLVNPATSDLQTAGNTKLDTLHADLSAASTAANQTAANTKLDTLHTDMGVQGTGSTFNPPAGGAGLFGWLSGIYKAITGTLTVTQKDSGGTDMTDTTNHALKVNVVAGGGGGGGAVTNAGTFAVQNTAATPAGANVIGHVIVDAAPTTAVTLATAPALVAGSAVIGKVGIDQTTPGNTNLVSVAGVDIGALTETAPASDTASSGLNGRLQRIAQRLSSILSSTLTVTHKDSGGTDMTDTTNHALKVNVVAGGSGGGAVTNAGTFAVQNTAATPAGGNHVGQVGGEFLAAGATFTTPSSGQTPITGAGYLIANSLTNTSVTPMQFTVCRNNGGAGVASATIYRARFKTTDTGYAGKLVTLKLYRDDPSASTGITNGDHGLWVTKEATYIGTVTVVAADHFSDYEKGIAAPAAGPINVDCGSGVNYIYGLEVTGEGVTPAGVSKTHTWVLEDRPD